VATVPPAVAPAAKGTYGRSHPHVVADSIDFDAWAGSKEMDIWRKAAENLHRQAQAGVEEFLVILGEGAWSVGHSPWPVIRQYLSIPGNARRQCKDSTSLTFVNNRYVPMGVSLTHRSSFFGIILYLDAYPASALFLFRPPRSVRSQRLADGSGRVAARLHVGVCCVRGTFSPPSWRRLDFEALPR
jgi:hypothetical protein